MAFQGEESEAGSEKIADCVELDKAEETKMVCESHLQDKARDFPVIQELGTTSASIFEEQIHGITKGEEKTKDVTRENDMYRKDSESEEDTNHEMACETGETGTKNTALSSSQTSDKKLVKKVVLPLEAQNHSKKIETSESRDNQKLEEEGTTNKEASASISKQNILEEERVKNFHVLTSKEEPEIAVIQNKEEKREKQENAYTSSEGHSSTPSKVLKMPAEDVNTEKHIIKGAFEGIDTISTGHSMQEQIFEEAEKEDKPDEVVCDKSRDLGKVTKMGQEIVEMGIPSEEVETNCILVVQDLKEATVTEYAKDTVLEPDSQIKNISSQEDEHHRQSSEHGEIPGNVSSAEEPAPVLLEVNQRKTVRESNVATMIRIGNQQIGPDNFQFVEMKPEAAVETELGKIEQSEDDKIHDKSDENQNDGRTGSYEENQETSGIEAPNVKISSGNGNKDKGPEGLCSSPEWDLKNSCMTLSEVEKDNHAKNHTEGIEDQQETTMTAESTETLEPNSQSDEQAGKFSTEEKISNEDVNLNSETMGKANEKKQMNVCSISISPAPVEPKPEEVDLRAKSDKEACLNMPIDLGKNYKTMGEATNEDKQMEFFHISVLSTPAELSSEEVDLKAKLDEEAYENKPRDLDKVTKMADDFVEIGIPNEEVESDCIPASQDLKERTDKESAKMADGIVEMGIPNEMDESDCIPAVLKETTSKESAKYIIPETHSQTTKISTYKDQSFTQCSEHGQILYTISSEKEPASMHLQGKQRNTANESNAATTIRTENQENFETTGKATNEEKCVEVCGISVLSALMEQSSEEVDLKAKLDEETYENKPRDLDKVTNMADDTVEMGVANEQVEPGCILVVQEPKETTDKESAKGIILETDSQTTKISTYEDQSPSQSSEHGEILDTVSLEGEPASVQLQCNPRNTENESNAAIRIRTENQEVEASNFQTVETEFEATVQTEPVKIELSEDNEIHDKSDENQNDETTGSYEKNHETFSGMEGPKDKITSDVGSKEIDIRGSSSSQEWDEKNSHMTLSEVEKNIHAENQAENNEDNQEERTMTAESTETLNPNGQRDEQTGQLSTEQKNLHEDVKLMGQKNQNEEVKLNSETTGKATNEEKQIEFCSIYVLSAPAEQSPEKVDLKAKLDEEAYENKPRGLDKITNREDDIVEMGIPNEMVESDCIPVVQDPKETTDKESAKETILETDGQTTKISTDEDQSHSQSSEHREILYTVSLEEEPASVRLQGNQRNTAHELNAATTVRTENHENHETFSGFKTSKVIISSSNVNKDIETESLSSPQEWDGKNSCMTLSQDEKNIRVENHTGDIEDNQVKGKMTAESTETLEPDARCDKEAGQLTTAQQKNPNKDAQSDKEAGQLNSETMLIPTNEEKQVEVCSLSVLSAPVEENNEEIEVKAVPEEETCENNLRDIGQLTKKKYDIVEMGIPNGKVESESSDCNPEVQGLKETTDKESAKDIMLENDIQTTTIGLHENQNYGKSSDYGQIKASNFQTLETKFETTVETEPVKIELSEDDQIHGKPDRNQNDETTGIYEENQEIFSEIEVSNIKPSSSNDRKEIEARDLTSSQEWDNKNSHITLSEAEKNILVKDDTEDNNDEQQEGMETDGSTEALKSNGQNNEQTGQLRTAEQTVPNKDVKLNSATKGTVMDEENHMKVCRLTVLSARVEQSFEEDETKAEPQEQECENKLRDLGKITEKVDAIVEVGIPGEKVEYDHIPVVQGLKETTDKESEKEIILESDSQSAKISSHEDQRYRQSTEQGEILYTISSEEESPAVQLQGNKRNTVETSNFQMLETKVHTTAKTEPVKINLSEDDQIHSKSDENQSDETPASCEENHDTFSGTKASKVKISSRDDSKDIEADGLSSSQHCDDKNSHVSLSEAEKKLHAENHAEDIEDNKEEGTIKADSTEALEFNGHSDEQARQLGTAELKNPHEDVKLVEDCEKFPEPNFIPLSPFEKKEIMKTRDDGPSMNIHLSSHEDGLAEEITSERMDAWKNGSSYDDLLEGPNNLNFTSKEDNISSASAEISHAQISDKAKDFRMISVDSLIITTNDSANPTDESSASVDPTSQGEAMGQEGDEQEQEEYFNLASSENTVQNTNSNENKESNRKSFEHSIEVIGSSEKTETKETWGKGRNKSPATKLPADDTTSAEVSNKFKKLYDSPLEIPKDENIISNKNEDLIENEKLGTVHPSSTPILIDDVANEKDELFQEIASISRATETEGKAIANNKDRERQEVDFNMTVLCSRETLGNASFHEVKESDNKPIKQSPEMAVSSEKVDIKETSNGSKCKEVYSLSASQVSNKESKLVEAKDVLKTLSVALLEGSTHEDITSDEQKRSFSLEGISDASGLAEAQKVEIPSSHSTLTNITSVTDQKGESFSNVGLSDSTIKRDLEGVKEYNEHAEPQLEVSNVVFKEQISGNVDSQEKIMSEQQSQFLLSEQVSVEEKLPVEEREVTKTMEYENHEATILNTPENDNKQMGISYLPVSQFLIDRIMREEDDKSQIMTQEEGSEDGCKAKDMKQQETMDLSSDKNVKAIEDHWKPGGTVVLILEGQSCDGQEFASNIDEGKTSRNASDFSVMETLVENAKNENLASERLTHIVPKGKEKHPTSEKSERQSEVKNEELINPGLLNDEKNNCAVEVMEQKAILDNNETLTEDPDTPSVNKTNSNKALQEGSQQFVDAKEIQANIEMCEKAAIEDHAPETIVVTEKNNFINIDENPLNTQHPTRKSSSPVVEADQVLGEALEFATDGKEVKTRVDNNQDGSTEQTDSTVEGPIEEIKLSNPGKVQLLDMEKHSMDESNQMAENILEEKNIAINKDELNKIDMQIDKDKTDGEEDEKDEEELEVDKSATDAPVTVETRHEVKPTHKKSHNILSGIKSKVKHSIAKVKKAIIGKSSQSKMMPPK